MKYIFVLSFSFVALQLSGQCSCIDSLLGHEGTELTLRKQYGDTYIYGINVELSEANPNPKAIPIYSFVVFDCKANRILMNHYQEDKGFYLEDCDDGFLVSYMTAITKPSDNFTPKPQRLYYHKIANKQKTFSLDKAALYTHKEVSKVIKLAKSLYKKGYNVNGEAENHFAPISLMTTLFIAALSEPHNQNITRYFLSFEQYFGETGGELAERQADYMELWISVNK